MSDKTISNIEAIDKQNQQMTLPPIRHLEAFMAVAHARSFRVAAERLNMSQPALSQNIALLEAYLGVSLFARSTRTVRLTEEGVGLQRRLAPLLPALHDAIDLTRHQANAEAKLRLGILASAAVRYLPAALASFRDQCPHVEVSVQDGSADGLFDLVHQGKLDLAVASFLPHDNKDVNFQKIIADPFMAVLRRDHPLAGRDTVNWSELLAYDFIAANAGSGTRHAVEMAMKTNKIVMRTVMEFGHFSAVAGMVEAGMGVSALPRMNCPTTDHPLLCAVELIDPPVYRDLGILTNSRDGGVSRLTSVFRDHVIDAAEKFAC